jgi:hypothetical protein
VNSFSDLYPFMIRQLKSCPKSSVMQALYLAAEDFCDRTEAWTLKIEDIDVVADQQEYELSIDYDARVKRIENVWLDDVDQETNTFDLDGEKTLKFRTDYIPDADDTDGMDVQIVLVPRPTTHEFEENFFERWAMRAFRAKAFSDLMFEKDKAWSDPVQAQRFLTQYRVSCAEAILNKQRQNKGGDLRVVPRQFV